MEFLLLEHENQCNAKDFALSMLETQDDHEIAGEQPEKQIEILSAKNLALRKRHRLSQITIDFLRERINSNIP